MPRHNGIRLINTPDAGTRQHSHARRPSSRRDEFESSSATGLDATCTNKAAKWGDKVSWLSPLPACLLGPRRRNGQASRRFKALNDSATSSVVMMEGCQSEGQVATGVSLRRSFCKLMSQQGAISGTNHWRQHKRYLMCSAWPTFWKSDVGQLKICFLPSEIRLKHPTKL